MIVQTLIVNKMIRRTGVLENEHISVYRINMNMLTNKLAYI